MVQKTDKATKTHQVFDYFTETYLHQGLENKVLLAKNGLGQEFMYVDGEGIDEHFGEIRPNEVKTYVTDHLGC